MKKIILLILYVIIIQQKSRCANLWTWTVHVPEKDASNPPHHVYTRDDPSPPRVSGRAPSGGGGALVLLDARRSCSPSCSSSRAPGASQGCARARRSQVRALAYLCAASFIGASVHSTWLILCSRVRKCVTGSRVFLARELRACMKPIHCLSYLVFSKRLENTVLSWCPFH